MTAAEIEAAAACVADRIPRHLTHIRAKVHAEARHRIKAALASREGESIGEGVRVERAGLGRWVIRKTSNGSAR